MRRLVLTSLILGCGADERPQAAPLAAASAAPAPSPTAAPVLRVRARRAEGAAIAGAELELWSGLDAARESRLAAVTTDAAGAAELPLPAPRAEFLRLRATLAGSPPLERPLDPRDAALELTLEATGAEAPRVRVAGPVGTRTEALWAALEQEASWSTGQQERVAEATPGELAAACERAAAAGRGATPQVRALALAFALGRGCGPAPGELAAELEAIGADEPIWALRPELIEAPLAALALAEGSAAARAAFIEKVIAAHASASLVAELLFQRLVESEDEAQARKLVASLRQPRFAGTRAAASAHSFDPDHLRPGTEIPAFTARTLDGATISRESLRGRPYVLDFWGTWCGGCVEEMPTLHAAYAAANGVERPPRDARGWRAFTPPAEPAVLFISVASDDTPANLAAFRRERWPMPWVNVLDEDTPGAVTKTLQVDKFPTALFVDARGIIVQRDGDLREGALALARTSPAGERRP